MDFGKRITMTNNKTIAESNNFIILDKYTKIEQTDKSHQSEADMEREFIEDLQKQGYEYAKNITTPKAMLDNVRTQLQLLNNTAFTDSEWQRFCDEYLNRPNDNHTDKTSKIHDNYIHDFTFDDGRPECPHFPKMTSLRWFKTCADLH